MKTHSIYTLLLLTHIFFSCSEKESSNIIVDLEKRLPVINYSAFVDSVKEITLKSTEDLFISRIDRFYIDGEFVFIEDGKVGVLVFSLKSQELVRVIDYFGQGPGEFPYINASSIDKNKKQILVFSNPTLYKYTYGGEFIETTKEESDFFHDFYALKNDEFICLYASAMNNGPSGVWLADKSLKMIKPLKDEKIIPI